MGGNAFRQVVPSASFPRLPPAVYVQIKGILAERLTPLFTHLTVPQEAPEKIDHGDVDFVVACPNTTRYPSTQPTDATDGSLTLEDIRTALGARVHIPSPLDVRGTSNFAVPFAHLHSSFDLGVVDGGEGATEPFVQVDVNVRVDEREWARVVFFHAYGDLGMILGQLAAGVGLHIGEKGLKMSSAALAPTHSTTFALSDSFDDILRFFDLSMERWQTGFGTRQEIFEWIATSRFYDPRRIVMPQGGAKARLDRAMYRAFFTWNEEWKGLFVYQTDRNEGRDALVRGVQEEALVFFGRKEEFDALVENNIRRVRLKMIWNGTKVGEWTGLSGWGVGRVMKHVRQTVGEDKIAEMEEEKVREVVLEAKRVVENEREEELAAGGPG